jgi:hypothetical protein
MSVQTKSIADRGPELWPGVLAAAIAIVNIVLFVAWTATR